MTARSAYVTSYLGSRRIPFSDVGNAFIIDSVRVNGVTPHNSLPYLNKQQKRNVIRSYQISFTSTQILSEKAENHIIRKLDRLFDNLAITFKKIFLIQRSDTGLLVK